MNMLGAVKVTLMHVARSNPMGTVGQVAKHAQRVTNGVSRILGPIGVVTSLGSAIKIIRKTDKIDEKCKPEYLLQGLKSLDQTLAKHGNGSKEEPALLAKRENIVRNTLAVARVDSQEILNNNSLAISKKHTQIAGMVASFSKYSAFPGAEPGEIINLLITPPSLEEKAAATILKENKNSEKTHGIVDSVSFTLSAAGNALAVAAPLFPPLAVAGAVSKTVSAGIDLLHLTQSKPQKIEELVTQQLTNLSSYS